MCIDEEKELAKIADFLAATSGCIKAAARMILERAGCKVIEHGYKFNFCFEVRYGENCAHFFLQNLYLEIATRDRDARPLEFDEKLKDFSYFVRKTMFVIQAKLKVLLELLTNGDMDKAIEKVFNDFGEGRIVIHKLTK